MAKRKFSTHKRLSNEKKSERRKQRVMAILIGLLMVVGLAGIAVNNGPANPDLVYNDVEFELRYIDGQPRLFTQFGDVEIPFYYMPQNTLGLNVTGNLTAFVASSPSLIISSNPYEDIVVLSELMRYELPQYTGKLIGGGVTVAHESYPDFPIFSCGNDTQGVPLIVFEQSDTTSSVLIDGQCALVKANPQDMALIRDRILYSILGIVNE